MSNSLEIKDEERVIQKFGNSHIYIRSEHAQGTSLRNKLKSLYNISQCLILPSGMSAISCCLNGLLDYYKNLNINLFISHELYCDTPKLINSIKNIYNIKTTVINVTEPYNIISLFKNSTNNTNVLFIESCTNPHGYIFDFDLIDTLRKLSRNLVVVVDNTWLSAVSFNPFNFGADVVVSSLTKYYSGGNAIAGTVLTNNLYFNNMVSYLKLNGLHVSPDNAKIISENIDSLSSRIEKSSLMTKIVIERYESNANTKIIHPYQKDHPSYNLAKKYLLYYPSVLVIEIPAGKDDAIYLMGTKITGIEYKTSFGARCSRFDPYPKFMHNINKTHCRLAIGYNDDIDLIKRLDDFFEKVSTITNPVEKTIINTNNKINDKVNDNLKLKIKLNGKIKSKIIK